MLVNTAERRQSTINTPTAIAIALTTWGASKRKDPRTPSASAKKQATRYRVRSVAGLDTTNQPRERVRMSRMNVTNALGALALVAVLFAGVAVLAVSGQKVIR